MIFNCVICPSWQPTTMAMNGNANEISTHRFAISDQRFPSSLCASDMMRSSSSDHGFYKGTRLVQVRIIESRTLFIEGSRWLCHRSRHCFPVLPWPHVCDQKKAHHRSEYHLDAKVIFNMLSNERPTFRAMPFHENPNGLVLLSGPCTPEITAGAWKSERGHHNHHLTCHSFKACFAVDSRSQHC